MAEPVRTDRDIVVELFPEPPALTDKQRAAYEASAGKVAQACKRAREDERKRFGPYVTEAVSAATKPLTEQHGKELTSLALHMQDTIQHVKGAAFWRGVGVMAPIAIALCAATGFGVSFFLSEAQMNAVAITQAATRPSAERMRDAMQAPDPSEHGFR